MPEFKTYLFSYSYEGSDYSLEIPASNVSEAKDRLSKMTFARYDGELITKIPAAPGTGILSGFIASLMNRLNGKNRH